jgi:phage major head subunit gpT-like protein
MITRYEVRNWLRHDLAQTPRSNSLGAIPMRVTTDLVEDQSEKLAFLGNVGPLKKHVGDGLQPQKPIEHTYAIKNDKFSLSVAIPGVWARQDKTGFARQRTGQLIQRYQQWAGRLTAQLLLSGSTTACFDNQNFFSTTHAYGQSGTYSNSLSYDVATPTAPTPDELALAINFVIAQMMGFPDDRAEPINEELSRVAVIVPQTYMDRYVAAMESRFLTAGSGVRDNVIDANLVEKSLIATPRMNGLGTAFIVVRTDANGQAVVFQENPTERRDVLLGEDSDHYAKNDELVAGIFSVGNAGYGLPQHAALCTLTYVGTLLTDWFAFWLPRGAPAPGGPPPPCPGFAP